MINPMNLQKEDIYNIQNYTDNELLNILDLSNPTDTELEAKILSLISKYGYFQNQEGQKLRKFYEDIYNHFFYDIVENNEDNIQIEIEGFENQQNPPATTPANAAKDTQQNSNDRSVNYSVALDYSKDKLNPLLKQTTKRLIVIDSQYRDNRNSSLSTDFTFNLSDNLKDVVNLKLYSFQIPYTWYVVNGSYGSNMFKLQGTSSGINSTANDIILTIPEGNYNASGLIDAVNNGFTTLKSDINYADISFSNTKATYNSTNCKTTLTFDLKNQYNENFYTLGFQTWSSPYDISLNRQKSIPGFLGFANQNYECNIIYSNRTTLPLTTNTAAKFEDDTFNKYFLDNSNNYFTIVQYVSNTTPDIEYSVNNPNIRVLKQFKIVLSNLQLQQTYTRTQLFNELNTQLKTSKYLINSGIKRVDITDISFNGDYCSHYEMKILLNRKTTVNSIKNQKAAIIFPNDTIIWTGLTSTFLFESQINELSNLIGETTTLESEYILNKYPAIVLKCKKPFYGYYIDSDTNNNTYILDSTFNNYTINILGIELNGTTINEYINGINNSIINLNTSTINDNNLLGVFKTQETYALIDVSSNIFNLNINMNKAFTHDGLQMTNILFAPGITGEPFDQTTAIQSSDLYKSLNLFSEYLPDINNGTQNLVINLSEKNTFVSKVPYKNNGFTFTTNRLFTIIPKPKSGLGSENFPPFDINFNDTLTVPYTFYNIIEMQNYLTNRLQLHQLYDTKNDYPGTVEQYNMLQGSYIKCSFDQNYLNVEFHIEFNSYISENDYDVVFIDQNVNNIPVQPCDISCKKIKKCFTAQNIIAQATNNDKTNNLIYGYPYDFVSIGSSTDSYGIQYSMPYSFKTWNTVYDVLPLIYNDFTGITLFDFYFTKVSFNFIGGNINSLNAGESSIVYSISNGLSQYSNNWVSYGIYTLSSVYCIDTIYDELNNNFIVVVSGKDITKQSATIFYSNPIDTETKTSEITFNIAGSCYTKNFNSNTVPICYKWVSNEYNDNYGNTGSILVSCGYSDTNTIGYSLDKGVTWIGKGKSLLAYGYDVAYNGSKFIACGLGTQKFYNLAESINGRDWNIIDFYCPIDEYVNTISCNGNQWVIGGKGLNTIAYSMDNGSTWIGISSFAFSDTVYSIQYFNLAYSDPYLGFYNANGVYVPLVSSINVWVAGGKGNNTIAYSNDGVNWDTNFIYGNWSITDISNSWAYNLKLGQRLYDISKIRSTDSTYATIYGINSIIDTKLVLDTTNNKIYLNPITIENGGQGLYTSDNMNSITIEVPPGTYSQQSLLLSINSLFKTTLTQNGFNIGDGTIFSTDNVNGQSYIKIRLNINKTYTTSDYIIIFYDPTATTLLNSANKQMVVSTWDSTLGWLLGYRSNITYLLSDYVDTSTNIVTLTGDSVVSVNIYNYFMIVLDDYNQNHLNDGLITTTKRENNAVTPSYTNKSTNRCDPTSNNSMVSMFRAITNSTGDNTNYNINLTQKQIYAAQEVLNIQNNINPDVIPAYFYTNSPFAKDLFAVLPLKIAGQQNNTTYIDYGGSLQNQERNYFGPVNISRMSIKLVNDRGQVVNLNNSNWSFTLICEQLYQYKKT